MGITDNSSNKVEDSANYSEIRSEDLSLIKTDLQDSMDISHIDLNLLSSEERKAEIDRCEDKLKHYSRMMYFISSNSGWFMFADRVNFNYISNDLKKGPG